MRIQTAMNPSVEEWWERVWYQGSLQTSLDFEDGRLSEKDALGWLMIDLSKGWAWHPGLPFVSRDWFHSKQTISLWFTLPPILMHVERNEIRSCKKPLSNHGGNVVKLCETSDVKPRSKTPKIEFSVHLPTDWRLPGKYLFIGVPCAGNGAYQGCPGDKPGGEPSGKR